MDRFVRALRWANRVPVFVAALALFTLMAMTFADVLLRSALNAPIPAAPELTRILMAIIVFAVMPYVSAGGKHIAVDLTDPIFTRFGWAGWRDGILQTLGGILLIWPARRVWVLGDRAASYGDVTEYLALPQSIVIWFIALAVIVTSLVMIGTGLLTLFAPHLQEQRT